MSSTIKIKRPDMPVPAQASVTSDSVGRYYNIKSYTLAQMVERDAQWQEMVGPVVEAARKLMTMRVGELPLTGYLSDNDISRAALGELNLALSAITEE